MSDRSKGSRAKSLLRLPAFVLAATIVAGGSANAQSIAGSWEGELVQPAAWPIFVRLDVAPGSGESTLNFLGQKIALGRAEGDRLKATIGEGPDAQALTAEIDHDRLKGALTGGGANIRFTLTRVPRLDRRIGRLAGWNSDLDAIQDRVLLFDRSFSVSEKQAVRARIAALRMQVSKLSDDAMRVRIARLLAAAHNAHTRLYLLRNRTELSRLPVRLWWFGKELRVVRTAPGFDRLLGCRVASLNGMPTSAAFARVRDMYSGSEGWKRYMAQYTLTSPSVLKGAGIGSNAGFAQIGVSDCSGQGLHRLPALPFERSEKAVESWWDLAPRSPSALEGWGHVLAKRKLPPYLANVSQAYWFERPLSNGLFFLQLNRAANAGPESVKDFADRAAQDIGNTRPAAIVVDLRFNTGGDSNVTKALVDKLVAAAGPRPIYLIVGRSTFSAGIVAAAQFRQAAKVTIVGEPIGDGLEFWAEGGNIILPYSGLAAHFANGAHSLSPRPCPTHDFCNDLSVASLAPDLPITQRWSDYLAGADPAMDAIERDVARRRRS